MDPVSVVVAALLAGASAGLTGAATDAVKDAYKGLKKLVQRAFEGEPGAEHVLASAEDDPDAYGSALEAEVRKSGVADDASVVEAAERLTAMLTEAGVGSDSFIINTHDQSQVGAIGRSNTVHMGGPVPHTAGTPDPHSR